VVTSRGSRAGLVARAGGRRSPVDVPTPDEAHALLARWVTAEPDVIAELARLCGYLPLALRIAAAKLSGGEPVAEYTARLAAGNRLAALDVGDDDQAAVRVAFDLSYRALPVPVQRRLRLLGLIPGPDVTPDAAGALAGVPAAEADPLLRQLAAAHLLEPTGPGRYTFHDLLRLYAASLVGDRSGPAGVASRAGF